MLIEVISDVVCPWCFIGKRRLERALAAHPETGVEVVWRTFQLNPDMPPEGMDRKRYLAVKFGSAKRAESIYEHIAETGASDGIAFDFDAIGRTPNTIDAHRLIRFAAETGETGRQNQVVELLFRRYFVEGGDIGEVDSLVEGAAQAGLDAAAVRAYLESDRDIEAMRAEDAHARRLGVTGVPCFIADGRYAISGAQAPEVFLRVLETAEQAAAAVAAD